MSTTSKQKKTIIYITEDTSSAQFRYRCHNVIQATTSSKRYQVTYFLKSELALAEANLKNASLVVINRQSAKDNKVINFIKQAHAHQLKVLFDLDDLVFDFKYLPLLMNCTNSKNVFYWLQYFWGIRRIAKKVDGFIVTNDFLGQKITKSLHKPYAVIPNSLNQAQIKASAKYAKQKPAKFTIGYFSGSPTHTKDFHLVEPALIEFLNLHPDAELKIVGYMDFSSAIQKLIKEHRIKFVKSVNYLKLQELIAKTSVNIAPLQINDFANCKSELKFFEAAVAKTTTIASPTYTFEQAIKEGETGFLATPEEWSDKLEFLYQNPAKNQQIALAAKSYALKQYFGPKFLKTIEEAYDQFIR